VLFNRREYRLKVRQCQTISINSRERHQQLGVDLLGSRAVFSIMAQCTDMMCAHDALVLQSVAMQHRDQLTRASDVLCTLRLAALSLSVKACGC
jgi:hypothetical protein